MNVFHSFTRRSLRQNKMRTLVTVIGIVLSMALMTAVIEGAYSGVQFLVRWETERTGAFHGFYYDIDRSELEQAVQDPKLRDTAYWQEVGWAKLENDSEAKPYLKPYLLIEAISDNLPDLVSIRLTEGRMPENGSELLLPTHLLEDGSYFAEVGDTVTLPVGTRTLDGVALHSHDSCSPEYPEELTDVSEKTYTVVGVYNRLSWEIEDFSCPGYLALTGGEGSGSCYCFFSMKHPSQYYSYADQDAVSRNLRDHTDLLRFSGHLRNENLSAVIYGFAAILIFLIAFGSISLIYNSFSISVSERTRQFGILKSVGATGKQIRGCVLYEAFLLSLISIPIGLIVGCTGIGITLYCLRDAFAKIAGTETQMRMILNPAALVIASVVCLITTLISAWIPAMRTKKVTAIEAIRSTADTKIRAREVKTSKLTRLLFGFEGMMASKNFKRNRRSYRSTVVSLFLSVTLFISASSFCAYLTDSVEGVASSGEGASGTDLTYYTVGEDKPDPDEVRALLSVEGVSEAIYAEEDYIFVSFPTECLSAESRSIADEYHNAARSEDRYEEGMSVIFLSDDSFRALLTKNGLSEADYFDPADPKGVMTNQATRIVAENGSNRWYRYELLDPASLPATLTYSSIHGLDGYTMLYSKPDEDGTMQYYYYDCDYLDEFWETHGIADDPDEAMALILPESEAVSVIEFPIHAILRDAGMVAPNGNLTLIFPYSMREAVLTDEDFREGFCFQTSFCFRAEEHSAVYDRMKTVLSDRRMDTSRLNDLAENAESERTMLTVVNVFSYGFIVLISLIALANVFNTVSTGISLRRREFAMLKSIGLSERGFRKMMDFECLIYGLRGLMWGLPASLVMTYVIYRVTGIAYDRSFYVPWYSVAIAVGSVFVVVFATMLYATSRLKKNNPIDALKNENL